MYMLHVIVLCDACCISYMCRVRLAQHVHVACVMCEASTTCTCCMCCIQGVVVAMLMLL